MCLFELTIEQKRAFNALKRAINKCEKSGMLFYNNYGTLGLCDKKRVKAYNDQPSEYKDGDVLNPHEIILPCNEWADDDHFFHAT